MNNCIAADLYDLIIIGGTAGALSAAISSLKSGLERVRLIEPGDRLAFDDLVPLGTPKSTRRTTLLDR